jgi:hypothetical protein
MPAVVARQSVWMHAHDFAEALGAGVELRMPEETAHVERALPIVHVEPHEAIRPVNERLPPKILIVRKERGRSEAMENRDQIPVVGAVSGEFAPHLARADFPQSEDGLLLETEVFV